MELKARPGVPSGAHTSGRQGGGAGMWQGEMIWGAG